jgi:hypothetical protein
MKKLITLLCVSCLTSLAFANTPNSAVSGTSDTEIKLEGIFVFQSGYANQNNLPAVSKNITDNRKKFAFYTESAIAVTVKQELDNMIAGAKIVLVPTTRSKTSTSYNGSHIFVETDYGKVELGSPFDAGARMRITGYEVAAAAGAGWSKYVKLDSGTMKYAGMKPDFDTTNDFYMESYKNGFDDNSGRREPARKVSYYTPKMQGFQFGISYTPDSANNGGHYELNSLDENGFSKSKTGVIMVTLPTGGQAIINQNVKDAVSAGMSYEYELLNDMALRAAITGEYAKPARRARILAPRAQGAPEVVVSEGKLSDLKAYNIGGVLTYGGFSCSASYGSLGKSLTTPIYHLAGRNTNYYNAGVAYGQGPIKTSLSYFKSSRYKNTIDAVTLGTEYKLTPGLLPYAEISYFKAKGRPVYAPDAPKAKTRGTVALLGAKFKF